MNLKKKMRDFFTLSRKSNGGFTLVELIVVIAILAILAGVAVPVYSGYVKKADRAADEQLLAAINKAFSAACIESGVNIVTLNSSTADIPLNQDGSLDIENMQPAACKEAFKTYFAGNEDSKFKVFEDIYYSKAKLGFSENSVKEYSYGGGTVYLNPEAIEALTGSTFLNAATLNGSSELLERINTVTNIAAGMAGSLSAVWGSEDFELSAKKVLGLAADDDAGYAAKQRELAEALAAKEGCELGTAYQKLAANSTVLYAAECATNFTSDQIEELFSSVGVETVKYNLTQGDTATGMAQAAIIYGMYTAYAHDSGNDTLIDNTDNPIAVLNALENDDEFIEFINNDPQGQKDLDAYLGALGMITDTAESSPAAVEHLLVNGFNNGDLKDLIADATGK